MSGNPNYRGVVQLSQRIHATARWKGFWPDDQRNLGEALMLITSELAEALEEDRQGRPPLWWEHEVHCEQFLDPLHSPRDKRCTCNAKPEGLAIELVDALIRTLDYLAHLTGCPAKGEGKKGSSYNPLLANGITVADLIRYKLDYNETRPERHGKAY